MNLQLTKPAIAAALVTSSGFVHALTNGSFEDQAVVDGDQATISFSSGWGNGGGSSLVIDPFNVAEVVQAYAGDQFAKIVPGSSIYQNVSFGPGTYEISFWALGDGFSTLTPNAITSPLNSPVASTNFSSTSWTEFNYSISTPGNYKLWFGTTAAAGALIDNVSITAVPEPETYAMMLAGLGAIGFMARRRKAV
jgi:PEP-CTERM motif